MLIPTYLLLRAGLLVLQILERDRVVLRKLPLLVFQGFIHGVGMLQCLGLTTYSRALALRPHEPGLLNLPYASFVDWGSRIAISSFMLGTLWSACIMAVDYDTTLIPMDAARTGWLDKLQTPTVRQFLVQARSFAVILMYVVHLVLCWNIISMEKQYPEWNTAYAGLFAEEWAVVIVDVLLAVPHIVVSAAVLVSAKPSWLHWLAGACAGPCSVMQPLTALLSLRCLQHRVVGQILSESGMLAWVGPSTVALMVIGLLIDFRADYNVQSPVGVEDAVCKALLCVVAAVTTDVVMPKEGRSWFIWGFLAAVVVMVLAILALRVRELRVLILDEPPLSDMYVISQNPSKTPGSSWSKRAVFGAAAVMVWLIARAPSMHSKPSDTTPHPHYYDEDGHQYNDDYRQYDDEDDYGHDHGDYDYSLYSVGHNDTLALQLLQDPILEGGSQYWVSQEAEDTLRSNISSLLGVTEHHFVLWDIHLHTRLILFYVFNDTANGVKEKWLNLVQDTGSELHKKFLLNSTFPPVIDADLCESYVNASQYHWRPDENATSLQAACSLWQVNEYGHHHYHDEYDEDYERYHDGYPDEDEEYAQQYSQPDEGQDGEASEERESPVEQPGGGDDAVPDRGEDEVRL